MNKIYEESLIRAENNILWLLAAGIKKEVIQILMTPPEKIYWQESEAGKNQLCQNCYRFINGISICDFCSAPHPATMGEEGSWYLWCIERGDAEQQEKSMSNHRKITYKGAHLIKDLLISQGKNIVDISRISSHAVNMVLSIQDRISFEEDGKWRIARKKRRGGHLDIKRFADKFFPSKNS